MVKERILKRAFELFGQYGIKTISMDNIALDLGISKKTIYKWFANKDQLVTETLTIYLDEVKVKSNEVNENAIEEFCTTINLVIQNLLRFHASFFYDLKKYHHQAYQIWQDYKQKHIMQLFQANLLRGVQTGLYRPDVNPMVAARLYVGQLETIYNAELFPPERFNRHETYLLNLKHFVLGVVSAEGRKSLQQCLLKHHCL